MGSWKIIEILLPRTSRMAASSCAARSAPRRRTLPAPIRPSGGISRMMASAVMLLPQPDSPTRHSVSPARMSKLTALSTSATRERVRNSRLRPSTSSTGVWSAAVMRAPASWG